MAAGIMVNIVGKDTQEVLFQDRGMIVRAMQKSRSRR